MDAAKHLENVSNECRGRVPTREARRKVTLTLTSVRASVTAVAARSRAALLCTMVLAGSRVQAGAHDVVALDAQAQGSCMAMFVSTVAALAMAPSRLLDRVLITQSIHHLPQQLWVNEGEMNALHPTLQELIFGAYS